MRPDFYSVGTCPHDLNPATAKTAIDFLREQERAGSTLWAYGGGETSATNWLVGESQRIAAQVGIPLTRVFTGLAYYHFGARLALGTVYKHRVNAYIRKNGVPKLSYAETARQEHAIFAASVPGDRRFMVGLPTPLALMVMSGITGGDNLRKFEDEFARQIKAILAVDKAIVIQWEMPIELTLLSLPPMFASRRQRMLQAMMDSVGRVMSQLNCKASWTIHLCNGDLKNKPVLTRRRQSTKVKVQLINTLTGLPAWRQGHTLEGIHDPLGDGTHLHELTARDRRAYGRLLRLPPMYSVGALIPDATPEQIAEQLLMMQDTLQNVPTMYGSTRKRVLTVGPSCGLGRRTTNEATQLFSKHRAVCKILDATGER